MPMLIEFNLDPILKARKKQKYIQKELRALGLKSFEDLPEELQVSVQALLNRNIDDEETTNKISDKVGAKTEALVEE